MITVATRTSSGSARNHINAEMEDHRGKWRLLGSEERDGLTVLEYLGRLSRKRSPPLNFLERLRKADPDVRHVAFRSLRKMLAARAAADEAAGVQATSALSPVEKVANGKESKTQDWKRDGKDGKPQERKTE